MNRRWTRRGFTTKKIEKTRRAGGIEESFGQDEQDLRGLFLGVGGAGRRGERDVACLLFAPGSCADLP